MTEGVNRQVLLVEKPTGKLAPEAVKVVGYLLDRAEKIQSDSYFANYLAEARKEMAKDGGFPLVRDLNHMATASGLVAAGRQLKFISDDFGAPFFKKYTPANHAEEWKNFAAGITVQQEIAAALLNDAGEPDTCVISLAATTDAT